MIPNRITASNRRASIRPIRLAAGLILTVAGLAGLVSGVLLANEPYPYDAALAVGMPVGLLIGSGGLAMLLVGVWLSAASIGRRPMQDH